MSKKIEVQSTQLGEVEFNELGTLMRDEKIELGTLASAIEQGGIHGWDKYGRFQLFSKNSPESQEALEAIANQFAWEVDSSYPPELSPLDSVEGFCTYTKYGWPKDALPDFEKLSKSSENLPVPGKRPSAIARSENSNLAIIGSMVSCVITKINKGRTKLYRSEAELIREMVEYFERRIPGLTQSNIETVFQAAKEYVDAKGFRNNFQSSQVD